MFQIPACLNEKFRNAVERVKDCNFVRVIAHYDADGVSSASMIFATLLRANKEFQISFLKDVSAENLGNLLKGSFDCAIIVDTGSSLVSFLENFENVIILDHHPPERDSEKVIHINPHFCNISGTTDACGSTLAYIFSIYMDEENWKNYHAFLSGVIGDRQHVNGYSGLNRDIVSFIEANGVKKLNDITLEGPTVRDMLVLATDPFLPEFTGNEKNVLALLNSLGIKYDESPSNLNDEQKTALYSWIALQLMKSNVETDIIQGLTTDKHVLESYGMFDLTLSNYVDAASRMNRQGLALSFLSGNVEKKDEIIDVWAEFKNILIRELYNGLKNRVEMESIQYFYVNEDSIAGAASGVLMNYALDRNRPVIALHDSNRSVHVSARGTRSLVMRGLNLGYAMKKCAESGGGTGGGHDIAAGATVPKESVKNFLNCLNAEIGKQIKKT